MHPAARALSSASFLVAATVPTCRRAWCSGLAAEASAEPGGRAVRAGLTTLPVTLARGARGNTTLHHIFAPEEANPSGNVHGGSILKQLESAGALAATRHCASIGSPPCATVRLEHVDFKAPVFIGNLAEMQARVTFTSKHSMRVHVDLWAEDVRKGTRVKTNAASLWYVALDSAEQPRDFAGRAGATSANARNSFVTKPVPQLPAVDTAEYLESKQLYDARKQKAASELHDAHVSSESWRACADPAARHTPAGAAVQLVQLMLPSDCVMFNKTMPVQGGVIMKLMDNAAGVCAAKYCLSNVVTAAIDTVDFLCPVRNGELVYVQARPVFTSAKSLEIEVLVEVEGLAGDREPCTHAYFTFVSLDGAHLPQSVSQLKLEDAGDEERWLAGKARYEAKRAARAAAAAAAGVAATGAAVANTKRVSSPQ